MFPCSQVLRFGAHEPAKHGERLFGLLARAARIALVAVKHYPRETTDRIGFGGGTVGQHHVRVGGLQGGSRRDTLGRGLDVVARGILEQGTLDVERGGVARSHVADGAGDFLYQARNTRRSRGGDASREGQGFTRADGFRPCRADGGEVVGKDVGRAAAVEPEHRVDFLVGKRYAGVW